MTKQEQEDYRMDIIMAAMSSNIDKAYTACRIYIEALEKIVVLED